MGEQLPERSEWQRVVVGTVLAGVAIGFGVLALSIGVAVAIGRAIHIADERARADQERDQTALLGVVAPWVPDSGSGGQGPAA